METDLEKRLIAAMQLGICLVSRDGHTWIECTPSGCKFATNECPLDYFGEPNFDMICRQAGVLVNNKIYGGILEALNVIDVAFERCGYPKLLGIYNSETMVLGEDTTDLTRISDTEPGTGGVILQVFDPKEWYNVENVGDCKEFLKHLKYNVL